MVFKLKSSIVDEVVRQYVNRRGEVYDPTGESRSMEIPDENWEEFRALVRIAVPQLRAMADSMEGLIE